MEQALVDQLLANAGLAALVGTRINWNIRPQASGLPAITLHVVSDLHDYTLDGRISLRAPMIQMDCWGGTWTSARAVKDALVSALDTVTTPLVRAFIENQRDSFDQGDGPETTGTVDFHRLSLDVRLWTN